MDDWVDLLIADNRNKQAKIDVLEHQLRTLQAQCRQVRRSVEMMAACPLRSAPQSQSQRKQAARQRRRRLAARKTTPGVAPQSRLSDLLDPSQPALARHSNTRSEMRPITKAATPKQQDLNRHLPNASGRTVKEDERLRTFFGPGSEARILELTIKARQDILTDIRIKEGLTSLDDPRPQPKSRMQTHMGFWSVEMPPTQE